MTFHLRPMRIPEDYVHVARFRELVNHTAESPEKLAEWEWKKPPETLQLRLMAEGATGEVVGCLNVARTPWMKAGRFWAWIAVDPAAGRQGLGARLLAEAEAFAAQHGATEMNGEVMDDDPAALAFALARGYRQDRHIFESELDVTAFDGQRFAGVVDGVAAGGIRLFTLADDPSDACKRRLYALDTHADQDIPGWSDAPLDYAQWHKFFCEGAAADPSMVLLAADGEQLVGYTRVEVQPDGALYTRGTAVHRAYRGRRIALALKLWSVAIARARGIGDMRTTNDSENGPMLAVNRKLGYVPLPGFYELLKPLG